MKWFNHVHISFTNTPIRLQGLESFAACASIIETSTPRDQLAAQTQSYSATADPVQLQATAKVKIRKTNRNACSIRNQS